MDLNKAERKVAFFGLNGILLIIISVILMLQDADTRFNLVGVVLNFIGWIILFVAFYDYLIDFSSEGE